MPHCLLLLLSTNRLNSFLDHVDVGEYIVEGDLEAYSCEFLRNPRRSRGSAC
jgi:hypothetical protein